ncbi:hypothetical protein L3Y34_015855 [Caenorhabditis briggsae]|uniref:Uncharacterized protein n=1 Tax=Caenorhabditis briggsae TaxID=6238 RepID=A0AAE9J0B4_CAEBR|nr:hypothetical protein L3Y34_015855 [Caenorhabditis briggsae]
MNRLILCQFELYSAILLEITVLDIRRLVQPSPPPKQNSPNCKSVPKGVVHQITLTPNKKQQKSTSTPPTSVRSTDLKSDYLDSGLEKQKKI